MRYNVTVQSADPSVPGLNLTVTVEAEGALAALDAAKPAMALTVKAVVGQLQGQ